MKSLDTNILIYASNADAPEHKKAQKIVESLLDNADEWIIAEQVLIETYRALRNPAVLQKPLTPNDAWATVNFYREEAGCQRCCYELDMWPPLQQHLKSHRFEARRTFDAVLAVTLIGNGVDSFYTRNTKDFKHFGFRTLINPVD
jgi:toxin-antitoxin system PIN domain toxin